MEYISREDYCEENCGKENREGYKTCKNCGMLNIPSAVIQPMKHGRWIWDSNAPHREHGAYKCNNCGCHSDFEENYCYNCGAKMDGGGNNEN